MWYIDIQDYMKFSGITDIDSTTSNMVAVYIDSTTEIINSLVWDMTYGIKEEQVFLGDVLSDEFYNTIQLRNLNVKNIIDINWLSYTGTLSEDYILCGLRQSKVKIRDLNYYIASCSFPYFNIKYLSGYQTIPDSIKQLQFLMVNGAIAQKDWQEVKSYTLWPRQVTFKDSTTMDLAMSIVSIYQLPSM